LVIKVLKTRPVSSTVQFAGGAEEKVNPGKEATTTWYETLFPVRVLDFCVKGEITGINSPKEPGQPWRSNRGMAPFDGDFSCMKWMLSSSIVTV